MKEPARGESVRPIVLIQAIDCVYSKESRGAPAATERNAFPRVLPWSGGAGVNEDTFVERWQIEPPDPPVLRPSTPLRAMSCRQVSDELALDWEQKAEHLLVWFRWNYGVGASTCDRWVVRPLGPPI